MAIALRAFLLIAFSMLFAMSVGFVYAQEEDSDANEECPSVRDVYVYVPGVGYGESVNGKVNLYGKKCQKIDDSKTLVRGKCTGPEVCKGEEYYGLDRQWHKLSGDKTELPKLKIEDVKKAVYEGVPAPATQAPLTPSESLWNQVIDPKPLGEQKTPLLSPSGNAIGDFLKQSDVQPSGFVDRVRQSVSNYLFPPSLNDTVGTTPLEGGTLQGIDPKKVQTTNDTLNTPGITGFGQQQTTAPAEPRGWETAWNTTKEIAADVGGAVKDAALSARDAIADALSPSTPVPQELQDAMRRHVTAGVTINTGAIRELIGYSPEEKPAVPEAPTSAGAEAKYYDAFGTEY